MTTAITAPNKPATTKPSALALMASRINVDATKLHATLKATVFKNATDEELLALVAVANEYSLNPFLKELYAFPAKGGGIVPIVSVDGWNKMLIRQPEFDGIEFEFADDNEGNPVSCTAVIHIKGRAHAVRITEYLEECYRETEPWKKMPRRMLRNRTLCQASRVAFGFSGVYNEDEAATITVESTVMPPEPPPKLVAAPPPQNQMTQQAELEGKILALGFDFTTCQKFLIESGIMPNADSVASFAEIPTPEAKRILRLTDKTLVEGMNRVKGGGQ